MVFLLLTSLLKLFCYSKLFCNFITSSMLSAFIEMKCDMLIIQITGNLKFSTLYISTILQTTGFDRQLESRMVSCTVEDSCEMHHKDVCNCGLNFAVSGENRPFKDRPKTLLHLVFETIYNYHPHYISLQEADGWDSLKYLFSFNHEPLNRNVLVLKMLQYSQWFLYIFILTLNMVHGPLQTPFLFEVE